MSIDLRRDGAVAVVTINNPAKKNALTPEMRESLLETFLALGADGQVRAVVLTGAGEGFCSGADVGPMGRRDLAGSRTRMRAMHAMIRAVHGLDKPVIAAVRGAAAGLGWSLAMASDLVIASETARFAQVFKRIGVAPDGGAVWFLARQLGFAQAKELVFSGRTLQAQEALALGLVQRLVPDDRLLEEAMQLAAQYAEGAPLALGMAKQMFAACVAPSLEQFLEMELLIQPQLMQTEDHLEGAAAFKEKRAPVFSGR